MIVLLREEPDRTGGKYFFNIGLEFCYYEFFI